MNEIERIEYNGCTIEVYPDFHAESPLTNDEACRLVGWHRNYRNPTEEFDNPNQVIAYARESGAHLLKVYMYDHGGTRYYLSDHNAGGDVFDSGWFGFLIVEAGYLKGNGWKRVTRERHDELMKNFAGVLEEYTAWANGDALGYVIKDADGEEIDALWGFFDQDYLEAEAKSAIDNHLREVA